MSDEPKHRVFQREKSPKRPASGNGGDGDGRDEDTPPPSVRAWLRQAGTPWRDCYSCRHLLRDLRPGTRMQSSDVCTEHRAVLLEHAKIADRWPWWTPPAGR